MHRRSLIGAGVAALAGVSLPLRAQQKAAPVVGLLYTSTPLLGRARVAAFVQRLAELGWVDGRTVTIDLRWGEGSAPRTDAIVAEFVDRKVDVIVMNGDAQVRDAMRRTASIPIVVSSAADPVGNGLVASLARPGGNVTGLSLALTETTGKRLELLRELVPSLRRLAILGNFANPAVALELDAAEAAARTLGCDVIRAEIRRSDDLGPAFEALRGRAEALYVCVDPLVGTNGRRINDLALAQKLPTMHSFRELVEAGGLICYGPDVTDMFRRAAEVTDRILRGARPGDLPVEQPTKFALVVNLKTAQALGLAVPPPILARADEILE